MPPRQPVILRLGFAMKLSVFILAAVIVSAAPAKADFLSLAPGDYAVTLQNTSSLCGGSNCVGTVHIGSPGATGFDWLFENVGDAANDFDFSPFTHTGTNGTEQCAFEGLLGINETNCAGTISGEALLFFYFADTATRQFVVVGAVSNVSSVWTAVPLAVPEPGSWLLLGSGILLIALRLRKLSR